MNCEKRRIAMRMIVVVVRLGVLLDAYGHDSVSVDGMTGFIYSGRTAPGIWQRVVLGENTEFLSW